MKNLYLTLFFCGANLISYFSYSQIISFPYFEEFESDFAIGRDVEFLPSYTGNEVQLTSRIFKDNVNGMDSSSALAVIPTSTFSGIIKINLNLSEVSSPKLSFNAKSMANGTGSYPAIIEVAASLDGGNTFTSTDKIGDGAFPNSNTEYKLYSYLFPSDFSFKDNVVLKITVKRSSPGSGTSAKVLIDGLKIEGSKIEPPKNVSYRQIQINEIFADPTGAYSPDSLILPNAEFVELFNAGNDTIQLKNFSLTGGTLPSFQFLPKTYLVLCSSTNAPHYSAFGNTLALSSWNTLTNSGEKMVLTTSSGEVVDSIEYNLSMYKDSAKQDGGWSLEQINPFSHCLGNYNWKASKSSIGATPGSQNSTYNLNPDKVPLSINQLLLVDKTTLEIDFDRPINSISKENLSITPVLEVDLVSLSENKDKIFITFLDSIKTGKIYKIAINRVNDCNFFDFDIPEQSFGIGAPPRANDIIISEIMADPTPSQGLPEVEYLELFNCSRNVISLKDIFLSDNTGSIALPDKLILPGEYLILAQNSSVDLIGSLGKCIMIKNWLSLNNAGETLSLSYLGEIIFAVSYSDKWYMDSEKKDGGYSLEMRNLNIPCMEEGNWAASLYDNGGTPGKPNSAFEQVIDLKGPEIIDIEVASDSLLILSFNEKINLLKFLPNNLSLSPFIGIESLKLIERSGKKIQIRLKSALSLKTLYTLVVKNISDCAGNIATCEFQFVLPEKAELSDILLNEILFNPRPNGVDFVEFYNASAKFVSLKDLRIGNYKGGEITNIKSIDVSKSILSPQEYIVFTHDPDIIRNEYPPLKAEHIFKSDLPSFPDEEGGIVLLDTNGNIIDHFTYVEEYHLNFLKSNEGVSLERISTNSPTNDKNNWHSASENVGFATPGYKNSQFKTLDKSQETFKIDPPIFSPDGDGYNDFAFINYSFEKPGNLVSVKLYDKDGRVMKNLVSNESLSLNGFIQWNGEDDRGNKVKAGIYMILIELFNSFGERKKYKKEVVVAYRF